MGNVLTQAVPTKLKPGQKPELLAPGGSLEKLKFAIHYGADAVYIGGQKYGLRSNADNFTFDEMREAVAFADRYGAKVFVAANIYAHNEDIAGIADYLRQLQDCGIAAIIVADPAIIETCKQVAPKLEIHLSTQQSTVNWQAVQFWKEEGVHRVVLGREATMDEIREIKRNVDIEIETFVHGAMCSSYSGRCVLSNHFTDRDSNRGGCCQSCRWKYDLFADGDVRLDSPAADRDVLIGEANRVNDIDKAEEADVINGTSEVDEINGTNEVDEINEAYETSEAEETNETFESEEINETFEVDEINKAVEAGSGVPSRLKEGMTGIPLFPGEDPFMMSAKDLCMIEFIPEMIRSGVESFKIEGRMKSIHYVATVVNAYRQAIDAYYADPQGYQLKEEWLQEIYKAANRPLNTGFFFGAPDHEAHIFGPEDKRVDYDFAGLVVDYDNATGIATVQQRNHFKPDQEVEFFGPGGTLFKQRVGELTDEAGVRLDAARHPLQLVKFKVERPVKPMDMMRKQVGRKK